MRRLLLTSAASCGLILAAPCFAQSTPQPVSTQPPAPAATSATTNPTVPAEVQPNRAQSTADMAYPGHEPLSRSASNIDPSDTRSPIAPRLPAPPLGPNATAPQLLHAARDALSRHATGEAQEALERAETRLLDRSTPPSMAGTPDSHKGVRLVSQALMALGHHDPAQATQAIDQALQTPEVQHFASD